jgi:hypothetical protein
MDDTLNNELNYVMIMPLKLLGMMCVLFLILINNLSLMNVLIFVVIYMVLTRIYMSDTKENEEEEA